MPEVTVPEFGVWMICAFSVLGSVYVGVKLWRELNPARHPPLDRELAQLVTIDQLNKVTRETVEELNRREAAYNERFAGQAKKTEGVRQEAHDLVQVLRTEVAAQATRQVTVDRELTGALGELGGQVRQLAESIKPVLDVPNLVRELMRKGGGR